MLTQRQKVLTDAEVSTAIVVQLACSSLLAGGAGLIAFCWLNSFALAAPLVVSLALTCSVGIGLLTTANIPYAVFLLHLTLVRIAEGRSGNVPQSRWLWSLNALFGALVQVNLRIDELFQRERLANEYREQLLQQTSERAATEERNHLARDLHDSIKQQIFSIRMSAIAAKGHMQAGVAKAQDALEDILKSTNEAQIEMQALLQQLRSAPLENTSLMEAVQTQAQALEYRSGAHVTVEMADLPGRDRFPVHMQETLFRIVQESLANIARHARAKNVRYTQTQDEKTLTVVISDDGQGFDTQAVRKGMGLANIHERARSLDGTAKIESEPGQGTILCIQIPLLLLPETKKQQEQEEYEVQRLMARAQGGLQLRSTIAIFTLVALITNLGLRTSMEIQSLFIVILAVCLLLMSYGLISAHLAAARLKHYLNEEKRELRSLCLHMHLGFANFLRLFLFVLWQITLWELLLLGRALWWKTGLLSFVVALLALTLLLVVGRQLKRAQERYYALLSQNLLSLELRLRWRDLRVRIILYLCAAIALLVSKIRPSFTPVVPWQWLQDFLLFFFLVLCIELMIDVRRLRPWRRLVKGAF
jgi:signal transduction histidine kinase